MRTEQVTELDEISPWTAPDAALLAQLDAAYARWRALCAQVAGEEAAAQAQFQQEMEWLQLRKATHHGRSSARHVQHILANMLRTEAWVRAQLGQAAYYGMERDAA